MSKINFNEIEIGGNNNNNTQRKTVSPGVDIFNIEEAEIKSNANGKQYVGIKFVNNNGQYFKEQFYITTTNALKRVKELATNAGVTLGEIDAEEIPALLIGNKVGLVVGGEKENAVIDGRSVVVTRARIKNAYNFSFRASELEKWKDSKVVIEDKTVAVPMEDTSASNDGLPF